MLLTKAWTRTRKDGQLKVAATKERATTEETTDGRLAGRVPWTISFGRYSCGAMMKLTARHMRGTSF